MADRRVPLLLAATGLMWASRQAIRRLRETDLQGKVVLITGGSRGLGLQLAREFARHGCAVAICARDRRELDRARRDLEARGARILALQCDVTDRPQVEQVVKAVTRRLGRIDILVNVAGIIQVGPIDSMTLEDFKKAMDVMFWGILYPTLAVLPQMRQRRSGWIVNITSIGGKLSVPHLIPYSSAKFAAVGLSEGLRAELARDGITVTTIVPGLMRTGSFLHAMFKGDLQVEFSWFSASSSLPLITISAERAARQIVRATKRGDAEKVLSTPAVLAARFHGAFPAITADIAGIVNHVLPVSHGNVVPMSGKDVDAAMHSRVLTVLTTLGRSAAGRLNEQSME